MIERAVRIALLCILAVPAFAAADGPAPSAEELRAAIFAAPAAQLPELPLNPEPIEKATCTVSNDCGPHSPTISCSSAAGNCSSGVTSVTCDGATTNCAPCRVSTTCGGTPSSISCTGTTTTNCFVEPHCFVKCGTNPIRRCNSPCP